MRIIERMDESGDEPIEVIPLHNAGAADVVRIVNRSIKVRAPKAPARPPRSSPTSAPTASC